MVARMSLHAIVVNTEVISKSHGDSERSIYVEFVRIEWDEAWLVPLSINASDELTWIFPRALFRQPKRLSAYGRYSLTLSAHSLTGERRKLHMASVDTA